MMDFKTQCQIAHVWLNQIAQGRDITAEQKVQLLLFLSDVHHKVSRTMEEKPLDLDTLVRLLQSAYGWTVDVHGEIHGLVVGDMGYDRSGVSLKELVEEALVLDHESGEYEQKFGEFIRATVEVVLSKRSKSS